MADRVMNSIRLAGAADARQRAESAMGKYLSDPHAPRPDEVERLVAELAQQLTDLARQNQELCETQRQLEDYRNRYIDLYDFAPLGYTSLDEDGYIQEINLAGARLLGMDRNALTGYPLVEYVAPDDIPAFLEHVRKCIHQRCEVTSEVGLVGRDGVARTVQLRSIPVEDPKHEIILCKTAIADVTDRKRAEETTWQLASIVESSEDAIISKTLDGRILTWNGGAEKLYGYSAQDVVGKPISILVPPEQPDELMHILKKLERGEQITRCETVRMKKDGSKIDVALTISPLVDEKGRVLGASTIARNITAPSRPRPVCGRKRRGIAPFSTPRWTPL